MVSSDTYAVVFCLLLQLTSSWADDSHEHVHIKLHLPEVVRKHTHMKMIYKHHFHPKKIKFHDPHVLDPLPFLDRPFHGPGPGPDPDLYNLGIKSQIIDIKKPKIKFPKLTEWDLEPNLQTFPPLGKLKHNLSAKFPIHFPDYDFTDDVRHFPKFSHIEEDDEELIAPEAEATYPGDLSMFGSSFARTNAVLPPQWPGPYSGAKDHRWSMPSEEWMDSMKYRLRDQPANDEKIMQAMDAYSAKSNFNSAVMDIPMERFQKNPKRYKLRGNMRLRGGKTRL